MQVHCLSMLFATLSSMSTDAVFESAAHVWHCSDCTCIFCIAQLRQFRHMLHVDFLCDVVACEFVCISPAQFPAIAFRSSFVPKLLHWACIGKSSLRQCAFELSVLSVCSQGVLSVRTMFLRLFLACSQSMCSQCPFSASSP